MQPEPCAAPSAKRAPGISTTLSPSKKTSIACSRCPPVTTTQRGPSAWTARASCRVARARPPGRAGGAVRQRRERARLGQVRRRHGHAREQPLDERRTGLVREQRRAGLGDHHGVEHDRRGGIQLVERAVDGGDRLDRAQHPDLDRVDADVALDGAHLGDDQLRLDRPDRVDADRALRRDRRDRGHPVDAAGGERLQVGLDPGTAAGVRTGDRQHGRETGRGGRHRRQVRAWPADGAERAAHPVAT